MNTEINKNSDAYKAGVEYGKQWIDNYKSAGEPIRMPIFEKWRSIDEYYYQQGVLETVNNAINFKKPQFLLKRNTRPNSIDKMVKDKGYGFIAKLGERGVREINIFADRVLQDFCHANILEINKYKNIFENGKFLQALFTEANKKCIYHSTMVNALQFYINNSQQQDETINGFLNYHLANQAMYNLLFNKLNDFKQYLNNGVFNIDPLIQAQREIYKEGWNRIGRDPYARTRVW